MIAEVCLGADSVVNRAEPERRLPDSKSGHCRRPGLLRQALSLDTAHPDAQRTIRAMAAVTVQAAFTNPDLAPFLSHISASPKFFHRPALQEA